MNLLSLGRILDGIALTMNRNQFVMENGGCAKGQPCDPCIYVIYNSVFGTLRLSINTRRYTIYSLISALCFICIAHRPRTYLRVVRETISIISSLSSPFIHSS